SGPALRDSAPRGLRPAGGAPLTCPSGRLVTPAVTRRGQPEHTPGWSRSREGTGRPMVEIGGDGQHANPDNVFAEAGTRQAIRVANVGQLAVLANYLLPLRRNKTAQGLDRHAQAWQDWQRFARNDIWEIVKVVFGWDDADGIRPGLDLKGTYEAWLNAARTFDRDPGGARAAMEICRVRMTQLPGGLELLRLYDEYRLKGKRPRSEARMWAQAV